MSTPLPVAAPRASAIRRLAGLSAVSLLAGCSDEAPEIPPEFPPDEPAVTCSGPEIRGVVQELGERLKDVPLTAPDTAAAAAMRAAYGPLVTPDLLNAWTSDPSAAPGRAVSSPWPDRIEIFSVAAADGSCRVEGEVIYVTSVEEARGGAAAREAITLRVTRDETPLISSYERISDDEPAPESPAAGATDLLLRYYASIDAGEYRAAYELWEDGGAASGQDYDEFAAGFAETEHVEVHPGTPGRVEPAAGSRYVRIPVVVIATTTGGDRQRFEGTYTLRRSVVDGATPDQRGWRIYSASIRPVE